MLVGQSLWEKWRSVEKRPRSSIPRGWEEEEGFDSPVCGWVAGKEESHLMLGLSAKSDHSWLGTFVQPLQTGRYMELIWIFGILRTVLINIFKHLNFYTQMMLLRMHRWCFCACFSSNIQIRFTRNEKRSIHFFTLNLEKYNPVSDTNILFFWFSQKNFSAFCSIKGVF